MSNRNLIPIKTTIFRNKLAKILEQLQKDKDKVPQQTKEAIVAEAVRLLSVFYKTIEGAQFKPILAIPGTKPEFEDYNTTFELIKDDIDILFAELENLESIVVEQFNTITTQTNRINSRVKRLSSRITDFALYSKLPIKNALFFTDSFTDTSKLDTGSSLLNASECDVNQAEGILTLPIDQAATETLVVTAAPVINSNSNGRPGNNEEVGALQINNNLSVILDNNPDTWFEYERVVQEDDGVPLVLDFAMNLITEQVINFIRINPNNFGTKTEIEIEDISTSVDGLVYKSIKDDIPITGFLLEDEPNVFKLAPSTNKFAGQGLFTFTPRFAKYIRIILRQISPYLITTVQKQQFRYAIGIRDVEVKRLAFENTGEAISSVYDVGSEIKKIVLRVNQIPLEGSELADIDHQVSFDDGNTWINIQPLSQDAILNVPTTSAEVVNVNTEDSNSIKTTSPATTLRYKTILKRNDNNFNESSTTFAESIQEIAELKSIPLTEPWALVLDNKPIVGSVAVLDTNFGSRGNTNVKYLLGIGTGASLKFKLPWDNLQLDMVKDTDNKINFIDIIRVFVGGEEWTRVDTFSGESSSSKVYTLSADSEFIPELINVINTIPSAPVTTTHGSSTGSIGSGLGQVTPINTGGPFPAPIIFNPEGRPPGTLFLHFGNGTTGKSPDQNSLIEILFTDERLFPVSNTAHISKIKFPTSIDKSTISIYRKGLILQHTTEISRATNIHRLAHRNIVIDSAHPIKFTDPDGVFVAIQQKAFSNGLASPEGELTTDGDWSIDKDRGIIFSFTKTEDTPGTVTYFYQSQALLSSTDWDWDDDLPIHQSIVIKDSAWVPNKVVGHVVPDNVQHIHLPHFSIIEGSIQFVGTDGFAENDNPFLEEVPFLNGINELSTVVKTQEQIPVLAGSPVANFTTSLKIHPDTLLDVSFSNAEIFVNEEATFSGVDTLGDYYVDRPTSTIYVHTGGDTFTDTGKAHYFIEDPSKIDTGIYSIDYERGEIHLQRSVPDDTVTVNYEYSEYYMRYNVARTVPATDWELDPSTRTIKILSNETSNRAIIPNVSGTNIIRPAAYQVNYKYIATSRRSIGDLQNFFTPILKDYVLQVVTADFL
jgi:hypothetical protein